MKKLFTLLLLAAGSSVAAQSYVTSNSIGTTSEFDYLTTGTGILAVPSTEVLSSTQALPFSWNFYGAAVSSYKVSDNGYITFNTSATTSTNANVAIPAAAEPNHAIYAFWDDLNLVTGSGTADAVKSWTYGTAPNRVHVIQWHSVTPVSGTGFVYATIRIYECGDFDIVLPWASATGLTGTVGCENSDGTSAASIFGAPSMAYPTGTTSAGSDDRVYSFIWDGTSYDLTVKSISLDTYCNVGANTVSGTIQNMGGATITSFDLVYTIDGGTPVVDSKSGLSIAPGSSYSFTHSTAWNVAAGGQDFALCVWGENINGNADERTCNDSKCTNLFSHLGVTSPKTVLVEEFTGAWCGWCPDGAVVLEDILDTYPTTVVGVSVHDGDAMEIADGIRSAYGVSAYPNGQVDRYKFPSETTIPHSRGAWKANTATRLSAFTPVEASLSATYDNATRAVNATLTATFSDYAVGDHRMGFMIIEDDVTGTGSGYNQVNYLNTTAGHPYYGAGDPIIGFSHMHVLRYFPGSPYGNAGIIPTTVNPSSVYTNSWSYTLPATWDETQIKLVGWVYEYDSPLTDGEMLDAVQINLPGITATPDASAENYGIQVVPNPVSGLGAVHVNLPSAQNVRVEVFNMVGQSLSVLREGSLSAGMHTVFFDASEVEAGVYFVRVESSLGVRTEKIVVSH